MLASFVRSGSESSALACSVDRLVLLVKSSALDLSQCSRYTAVMTTTARDRARAELTDEIKAVARRHLAEHGSAALSLRAVAREVGMVSSAVYRYFPSRDELLTALIIDAYDAVGERAEAAERASRNRGIDVRWLKVCEAVRAWALANPHEYALIYGSPVPGYAAP